MHQSINQTLPFCTLLIIISGYLLNSANAKNQYVQPLMGGLQVAIPYDIANIFNRPVGFGSIAGILLSFSMLTILFFGVITSPFGYMFGIPSEKYVMGQPYSPTDPQLNSRISKSLHDEDFGTVNDPNVSSSTNGLPYPDFLNSMFQHVQVQDVQCQKLVLCHAHRAMEKLPKRLLGGYQFFSKKLVEIPQDYKKAIHIGLKRQQNCEDVFDSCPENVFGIVVRSAIHLLPKWTRRKALKPHLYF